MRNASAMAKQKLGPRENDALALETALVGLPLWQLDMAELTGHNIEARGREQVNELLQPGWLLLHI